MIDDVEVVAVVLALAGVRTGDAVAQSGAGARVERGLLAMSGVAAVSSRQARVAVAGSSSDVALAAAQLGDGGRLVALAPDAATARADGAAAGVPVQHVVELAGGVAWSGRLTRD
jgi:hypothetical protein